MYRIAVVVAAGSPDWLHFMTLDPEAETLPEGASNVNGGVGYVGGIVTDTTILYP